MRFHFLPGQNYDCVQCGKGCLDALQVRVDEPCARRVEGSYLALQVQQEHGVEPFYRNDEGELVVRRLERRCVFLDEQSLCAIHRDFGIEAKPVACRSFPFTVVRTPDGVFVGLSHYCTAAKGNSGRALAAHQSEVEALMERIDYAQVGFEPVELGPGVALEWEAYRAFEQWLRDEARTTSFKNAMGRGLGVAARLLASGQGVVAEERLLQALAAADGDPVAVSPELSASVLYGWAACVAHVASTSRAEFDGLIGSLMDGGPLHFQHWSWRGSQAEAFAAADELGVHPMVTRYFDGLLFTKQLTEGRSVFSNLCVFYRLYDWLAFYAGLSRLSRGGELLEDRDVAAAIDFVELNFVTHGRRLDDLHRVVGQHLLEQMTAS